MIKDYSLDLFRNARVLVTGGAGFVGSRVVSRLAQFGARVTVLDDLFSGEMKNLAGLDEIEFVKGSVTDERVVEELVRGKDYVYHLAARNIIVSTKNPREDFSTNIGGTLNVLLAAREHGIKRVVYTSTCSVYGNPRHLPIDEDDPRYILSPYAASKLSGELYCTAFFENYGVPMSIVRYSNVFGPFQNPSNPYCGVVSKFMDSIANGKPPQIHGDGVQTRDFTFIDDAVDATLAVGLNPRAEGEVFNVGTGVETSVRELCRVISALMGSSLAPTFIERRDIDNIRRRVVSIEKIRRRVRWVPRFTIEDGLKRTVEWYKHQYL